MALVHVCTMAIVQRLHGVLRYKASSSDQLHRQCYRFLLDPELTPLPKPSKKENQFSEKQLSIVVSFPFAQGVEPAALYLKDR